MASNNFSSAKAFLIGAALLLSASQTNAATLISADLNSAGDGLVTIDKSTSLEWLDLTATVGETRSQVLASAYITQGFRYATQDEVNQLWLDAGATGAFVGNNLLQSNVAPAAQLLDLMGCTSSYNTNVIGCIVPEGGINTQEWNIGFYGSGPTDAGLVDILAGVPQLFPPGGAGSFDLGFGADPSILSRPDVGSYLVREVVSGVPEPSVWAMMILGFGFVGAALRARHNTKRQPIFG
jgi:hypothetical protein